MTCVQCGCDEDHACEGGCFWAFQEPAPIRSACVLGALLSSGGTIDDAARLRLVHQMMAVAQALGESIDPAQIAQAMRVMNNEVAEVFEEETRPALPRLWRPGDP